MKYIFLHPLLLSPSTIHCHSGIQRGLQISCRPDPVCQPQGNKEKHQLLPLPLHTGISSDKWANNMRLRFLFILKTRSLINYLIFLFFFFNSPGFSETLLQALLFCHCSPKLTTAVWAPEISSSPHPQIKFTSIFTCIFFLLM